MKKTLLLIAMVLTGVAYGQDYRSGDAEIDANLKIVNSEASKDISSFKLELSKTFAVPLPKIDLCFNAGMNAGDAYMALEISNIVRRPIEEVITSYKKNKGKGWGVIAKEMGIKPGSDAFHRLKGNCKNKGNKSKEKSKQKGGNAKGANDKGGKGNSGGNGSKGNGNGKGKKGK
jgi:uncharacterized membrane protein YgcG